MELKDLTYFLAVAEHLNYSRAAEQLYVTQPLLSRRIASLEAEFGVPLFHRSRRSVTLAPAGKALVEEAQQILSQLSNLRALLQHADSSPILDQTLEIGFEILFPRGFLTQTTFSFRVAHPNIDCHLANHSFDSMIHNLSERTIDIGFMLLPNARLPKQLHVRNLQEDRLNVAASSQLEPLLTIERFRLLAQSLPILLFDGDARGTASFFRLCESLNISPHFQFRTDMHSILVDVETGYGLTVLPGTALDTYASEYISRLPLSSHDEAALSLAACWNPKNKNPTIPLFLDFISNACQPQIIPN